MVTETETFTRCDVFGTRRDVRRYRVTVTPIDDDGEVMERPATEIVEIDLSPRGIDRLLGLIRRGVTPPHPRAVSGG